MPAKVIKARLYQRRDTSANWTRYNPVLAEGEFAYDIDKKKYKIGDGVINWNGLEFAYLGEITDANGYILKYKTVATEEYVNEKITDSVKFYNDRVSFPSIGAIDKLYVDLSTNEGYIWQESKLTYEKMATEISLSEEELRPLIEDIAEIIITDKLEEQLPDMVGDVLGNHILAGGDSDLSDEVSLLTKKLIYLGGKS